MKHSSKRLQILLAVALLLYACGYVTQFIGNYAIWQKNGGMRGGTSPPFPSLSPPACLKGILWFPYNLYCMAGCTATVAAIVYVRLSNGVNAVAHSCYDRRTPGKKDDVSFVVTKLDEERSIAIGIITRIIRQNL